MKKLEVTGNLEKRPNLAQTLHEIKLIPKSESDYSCEVDGVKFFVLTGTSYPRNPTRIQVSIRDEDYKHIRRGVALGRDYSFDELSLIDKFQELKELLPNIAKKAEENERRDAEIFEMRSRLRSCQGREGYSFHVSEDGSISATKTIRKKFANITEVCNFLDKSPGTDEID